MEVVQLLLKAQSNADTAGAADKARRIAPIPPCMHCPRRTLVVISLLLSPLTPMLLGALAETAFRARCKVGREAATPRRCPERRAV